MQPAPFLSTVLWTAQGHFLVENSDADTINRNTGVFWALLQCRYQKRLQQTFTESSTWFTVVQQWFFTLTYYSQSGVIINSELQFFLFALVLFSQVRCIFSKLLVQKPKLITLITQLVILSKPDVMISVSCTCFQST